MKVIINGGLKGGNGKSSMTEFTATEAHARRNKKVCVVDGDDDQQSLFLERQDELLGGADPDKLYKLIGISSVDIAEQLDCFEGEYDYVFIDLPGNLRQPGVAECYAIADIIFVPFDIGKKDLRSLSQFLKKFSEIVYPIRQANNISTKLYLFMNKVSPNMLEVKELEASKAEYLEIINTEIKEHLSDLGMAIEIPEIVFLKNYVPEAKVDFQRNSSTVEVLESSSSKRSYDAFFNEYNQILESYTND